jgi:hypothetical protein
MYLAVEARTARKETRVADENAPEADSRGLMTTVDDVFEHARWLIEHGRGKEKGLLILPRVESQRRRENKEQRKRIVMVVDPEFYAEWATWHEAYMLTCGENPVLARQAIIEAMKVFNVKQWFEDRMKDQSDEVQS